MDGDNRPRHGARCACPRRARASRGRARARRRTSPKVTGFFVETADPVSAICTCATLWPASSTSNSAENGFSVAIFSGTSGDVIGSSALAGGGGCGEACFFIKPVARAGAFLPIFFSGPATARGLPAAAVLRALERRLRGEAAAFGLALPKVTVSRSSGCTSLIPDHVDLGPA